MNIPFLAAAVTTATEVVTTDVISASMDKTTPLSERMALGLQTMVLGLGTVFSILIIIWGILSLFRLFFYTIPNSRKKTNTTVAAPQETEVSEEAFNKNNDEETVAAISAAIAVYLDKPVSSFRVVSFKRFDKQ